MFARASQQSQPCLSSVVHERVKEPISVMSASGNYVISSTINPEIAGMNRLPWDTNEFSHAEPWLYPRRLAETHVETNEPNDNYKIKESDKFFSIKEVKPNEINSNASNPVVKEPDREKPKVRTDATETVDSKVISTPEGKTNVTSSSSHIERSRQYIKMGTYNGKTSVDAFLRKFEVCSKNNGWSDEEKLNQLTCALIEPASQLLWEFDSNTVTTWSDLVNKLRLRYGSSDQASLYQTQLNTRRQKDGEDLGSLVQDIRRLMILAYPGPTSTHSETIAIRSFLDALRDKELALKLREREPETLDSAYKLALRLEGYRKAEREETEHSDRRPGRIKAVKEAELSLESVRKLLKEELEPRLEQLENRLNNGSNFTMRPPPNQGFVPSGQPFQWRNQWNRNGNNGRFRNQRQNPPRQSQLCFECGQPGHFARVCPSRQGGQPFEPETAQEQEPSTLRHVMGSNNAYLALKVNGKSTFALLDTGSELTLAPASLVKKEDIRSSSQTLRAANGTSIRVLGEASLNCEIDGYSFEVSCLITEQISELILGLEWLENQHALWNFGERWVKIQNQTFPIRTRKRQGNCRRIVVAQDVKVPPLSELDINTYAVVSHLRSTDGQWATQPQVLSSGPVSYTHLTLPTSDLV